MRRTLEAYRAWQRVVIKLDYCVTQIHSVKRIVGELIHSGRYHESDRDYLTALYCAEVYLRASLEQALGLDVDGSDSHARDAVAELIRETQDDHVRELCDAIIARAWFGEDIPGVGR